MLVILFLGIIASSLIKFVISAPDWVVAIFTAYIFMKFLEAELKALNK